MALMKFDTSVTAARRARIVAAYCTLRGYTGDPADNAAKLAFALGEIDKEVRRVVVQVEGDAAAAAAISTVTTDINGDLQ